MAIQGTFFDGGVGASFSYYMGVAASHLQVGDLVILTGIFYNTVPPLLDTSAGPFGLRFNDLLSGTYHGDANDNFKVWWKIITAEDLSTNGTIFAIANNEPGVIQMTGWRGVNQFNPISSYSYTINSHTSGTSITSPSVTGKKNSRLYSFWTFSGGGSFVADTSIFLPGDINLIGNNTRTFNYMSILSGEKQVGIGPTSIETATAATAHTSCAGISIIINPYESPQPYWGIALDKHFLTPPSLKKFSLLNSLVESRFNIFSKLDSLMSLRTNVSSNLDILAYSPYVFSFIDSSIARAFPSGPPANDNFVDAYVLVGTADSRLDDYNIYATKEVGEPTPTGATGGASIWYVWTAPDNRRVYVDTGGSLDIYNSDLDTVLGIYTGVSVGALTSIAENDDSDYSLNSSLHFEAISGTTYYIEVDGIYAPDIEPTASTNSETGFIQIHLRSGIFNDNFVDAFDVTPFHSPSQQFPSSEYFTLSPFSPGTTNTGATKEIGEPDHAGDAGGHSVWFAWTPVTDADWNIEVDTDGGSSDVPLVAVYTGASVNALTPLTPSTYSDGSFGSDHFAYGLWSFIGGTTYYIAVDGKTGTEFDRFWIYNYP